MHRRLAVRFALVTGLGILVASNLSVDAARAQDYSANKTPQQLFAGDCSACHKTPQGLAKGRDGRALAGFLREHYTTGPNSATLLGAYLAGGAGGGQVPANARIKPESDGATAESQKPERRQRAAIAPVGEPPSLVAPEGGKPTDGRRTRSGTNLRSYVNAGEGAKAAAIAPVPAPIPPDTEVLKAYATSGEPARTADKSPEASPDIRSTEPAVGALKPADPIPVEAKPSDPASTDKPAVN